MGLVFALQPDLRKSNKQRLVLKSSKQRFSLGGTLLFAGALLATMYFAAAPLFRVLWSDGGFFDKLLVGFIYGSIFGYPLVALFCWFFEEVAVIVPSQPTGAAKNNQPTGAAKNNQPTGAAKNNQPTGAAINSPLKKSEFSLQAWTQFYKFKWNHREIPAAELEKLDIVNWRGAVNVASIESKRSTSPNRYATKGHWMLVYPNSALAEGRIVIEKRAKREDIELLRAQIFAFFDLDLPKDLAEKTI
jgi:hypothetical protein